MGVSIHGGTPKWMVYRFKGNSQLKWLRKPPYVDAWSPVWAPKEAWSSGSACLSHWWHGPGLGLREFRDLNMVLGRLPRWKSNQELFQCSSNILQQSPNNLFPFKSGAYSIEYSSKRLQPSQIWRQSEDGRRRTGASSLWQIARWWMRRPPCASARALNLSDQVVGLGATRCESLETCCFYMSKIVKT